MPLFAMANAGGILQPHAAKHAITWAVATVLVVGKPLESFPFSWMAVTIGIVRLLHKTNWKTPLGEGCLGCIGFTMSLFVVGLALVGTLLDSAKFGTLAGSTLRGLMGILLLYVFLLVSRSNPGKSV